MHEEMYENVLLWLDGKEEMTDDGENPATEITQQRHERDGCTVFLRGEF